MTDDINTAKLAPPQGDAAMRNYLVFESAQPNIIEHNIATGSRVERDNPFILIGYNCIGAVRAADESEAVRAVIAHTRRIGKYAVIEATFLDFAADLAAQPIKAQPVLNP